MSVYKLTPEQLEERGEAEITQWCLACDRYWERPGWTAEANSLDCDGCLVGKPSRWRPAAITDVEADEENHGA